MMEPLVAYLHYLSIILTGGFLVGELVVCRPGMTSEQARRLASIDVVFFVSALAALATGLLRLFFYAKGVGFYTGNPTFWTKMALFGLVFLLELAPMTTFIRVRAARRRRAAPPAFPVAVYRRLNAAETALTVLIVFVAAFMARGVWMF